VTWIKNIDVPPNGTVWIDFQPGGYRVVPVTVRASRSSDDENFTRNVMVGLISTPIYSGLAYLLLQGAHEVPAPLAVPLRMVGGLFGALALVGALLLALALLTLINLEPDVLPHVMIIVGVGPLWVFPAIRRWYFAERVYPGKPVTVAHDAVDVVWTRHVPDGMVFRVVLAGGQVNEFRGRGPVAPMLWEGFGALVGPRMRLPVA
jgi:hypothetical protein